MLQLAEDFFAHFSILDLASEINWKIAIVVCNVCRSAIVDETTYWPCTLQLFCDFDSEVHSCETLVVLLRQLFDRQPGKNIHHGQLGHRKDGPMERGTTPMVFVCNANFHDFVEKVEGSWLIALGCYMEAIQSMGIFDMLVSLFVNEHLTNLQVSIE